MRNPSDELFELLCLVVTGQIASVVTRDGFGTWNMSQLVPLCC